MKYLATCCLLALLMSFCLKAGTAVIVKANVLCGVAVKTHRYDAEEMRTQAEYALSAWGYEIAEKLNPEVRFVDLFVYDYGIGDVKMVVTYRSHAGLHYVDEYTVSGYPKKAAGMLTRIVMERFPANIDEGQFINMSINDLFSIEAANKWNEVANSPIISRPLQRPPGLHINFDQAAYRIPKVSWPDQEPRFLVEYGLKEYFAYCMDYHNLRKQLKAGKVLIQLRINERGSFEYVGSKTAIPLSKRAQYFLEADIASIPTWVCDGPMEDIYLEIE